MFFNKGKICLSELLDMMEEYDEMPLAPTITPKQALVVERDGLRELLAWSYFIEDEDFAGDAYEEEWEPSLVYLSGITGDHRIVDAIWRRVMCRPGLTRS